MTNQAYKKAIKDRGLRNIVKHNPCLNLTYALEEPFEAAWLKLDEIHLLLKYVEENEEPEFEMGIILALFYAERRGEVMGSN